MTQRIFIKFLILFCLESIELSLRIPFSNHIIGPLTLLHALAQIVHIVIPTVLSRPQGRFQLRVAMQVSKESVLVLGDLIVLFPTTAVVRKIVLVLMPLLSDPRSHGKVRLVLLFITIETISIHISLE